MNKKKCKFCDSLNTHKYGIRLSKQRYKCLNCSKVFNGGKQISVDFLWDEYTRGKQTYIQLAFKYGCSKRTIQRKLDLYQVKLAEIIPKKVIVLMDTTY